MTRSLKGILLLFIEPYITGTRDSEKYIFPYITKVSVAINSSLNMLYNEGIKSQNMLVEASRFFVKEKSKTEHMTLQKFYTGNKFGLVIDLRSMVDQTIHGSGTRLVNTTDGFQLQIERKTKSFCNLNCHVFVSRQLESVQF